VAASIHCFSLNWDCGLDSVCGGHPYPRI
jgi:hypothetical protein